jgi:cytochrome c-type biogenesis protein CcmH/NrfG
MIGFWELIAILVMLGVMALFAAGLVWLLVRIFRKSARSSTVRPVAERLAELESLRKAEQITASEYEKQRAAIVSSI